MDNMSRNLVPPSDWSPKHQSFVCSSLILLLLVLTYSPLVWAEYAYGDDYWLLLSDAESGAAYLRDGRPLFALAQHFIHLNIAGISQLSVMRFLAAVWVGLISIQFFRLAKPLGGTPAERVCLAVAVGTLPCLHTYVAQANFWLAPLAGCFTIQCSILVWQTISDRSLSTTKTITYLGTAFFLYMCTATTYQPMLAWYWTAVLIFILDKQYLARAEHRRQVHLVIAIGLAFLCFYYVSFKLFFAVFDVSAKPRTQLTQAPLYKLYWFLRIQLPLALNFWHLWNPLQKLATLGIAAFSLALISGGYFLNSVRHLRLSAQQANPPGTNPMRVVLLRTGLLLTVVLLTHVHWLAIEDVPQSYRVIAPLGVAVLLMIYWSLLQYSTLLRTSALVARIRPAIAVALATAVMLICQYQAYRYWVAPQTMSYRFLLAELRDKLREDHATVHIIRQGSEDGLVQTYFIESFGRPSSERDWTLDAMIRSAANDSGVAHDIRQVTSTKAGDPVPADKGVLVLDMRNIRTFRMR